MIKPMLFAATLLAALPVAAQTPTGDTAPNAGSGTPQPAKEKLICRREAPIGSLIPSRKRCYTREEWDQIAQAARDLTTRMVTDGQGRPGGQ